MRLTAGFSPERLGSGTTLRVGFEVLDPPRVSPSPITGVEILYPAGLGIGGSGLGLESCSVAKLQDEGLAGCPADSLMGGGSAVVEVPLQQDSVFEKARITLFAGPVENGHLGLIFYANGQHPVIAELAFPGLVLPAAPPFGGDLSAQLPLVISVPEGPNAAVVKLETTLGPKNIIYRERVHGKEISFRPKGIMLPPSCPRGGFPFALHLHFEDGSEASTTTRVPCPSSGRPRKPIPAGG